MVQCLFSFFGINLLVHGVLHVLRDLDVLGLGLRGLRLRLGLLQET